VLGEVVALVHRPQLEPLIFHAGTYGAGRRSPSVDSLDPSPVAWSRRHTSVASCPGDDHGRPVSLERLQPEHGRDTGSDRVRALRAASADLRSQGTG
jgi:hypothetical protein